jgi:response regulator NasT
MLSRAVTIALLLAALSLPVTAKPRKRIKPIVEVARARFEDTQALRRELDEISQKLSDRKLVDKAKGMLMKARGLDEDAAYHAMRKLAMERGQTMAKVARDVIDMARVLL